MGKRYTLFILTFLLFYSISSAQKQTDFWYFGRNAGLNFNTGAPVALTNGQLNTNEGCSSISDASGNLLFYTDGIRVFNRNHAVMTNGNGLRGDPSSTQSGIIVPKPGSTTSYYIFTVDMQAGQALFAGGDADGASSGFRYSEVDMTLAGGLGAVVAGQKNILLRVPTTEGLTAVKHANNIDVWVIVHGWNNNSYFAYLVTAAGVNTTPVQSNVGPVVNGGTDGSGAIGYMKTSPDGSKIAACHSYGINRLVVSNFNTATGVVSNPINIPMQADAFSNGPYGVEFSNCNEYLYCSEMFTQYGVLSAWPQKTIIYRFDLNAADIAASKTPFATITDEWVGALQLASDGRIYCASVIRVPDGFGEWYGTANLYLHRINNPRLPGATFTQNAVDLAGRNVVFGLPPFITSFFNTIDFTAISNVSSDTIFCQGDSAIFNAQVVPYDSIRWYFGEPSTGLNNTSTLVNPKHLYANPGTYTATLYKYLCNRIDSIKRTINVRPLPVFNIRDTTICGGVGVTLNPGISGATYLWSTGATTQTATFTTAGSRSLTVTSNQCSYTDNFTISVNSVPSATITPSGPTTFCSPGSVTLSGPAGMDVYEWRRNGTPIGGQTSQTLVVTTSGSYTLYVVDNGCNNTSAATVVTVNSAPTVTVAPAGPIDICAGNNTTLTITTAGLSNIRWYRNAVQIAGETTTTLSVTTSGTYYATGDAGGCTGTSNSVVVNVNASSAVAVNIAPSANPICTGTPVTFTATPSNGGSSPSYQWYLNGNPVGSNSPTYSNSTLADGDQVRVTMTSNIACPSGNPANSNTVVINVSSAVPVSVSISPSANPVCAGTAVTFTATPNNGGTSPTYQWYLNGNPVGTYSATYTLASPNNGDQVRVQLTSSSSCATGNPASSNTVNLTVNPSVAASVSVAPSANPICAGTSVTFTATPTNGGAAPTYQWFLNGNPVGTNSATYTNASLANGDQVRVQLTSNAACVTGSPANSNTVNMTVNPSVAASVSIAPSANPICAGTSVTFTGTPTNGGAAPTYQWFLNGNPVGTNSATYINASLANGDQVRVQLTSNAACVTGSPANSNTVNMTVNPAVAASVSIAPSANPICAGTSVTFTATPTNGGATPTYQWLLNGNPVGTNSATYTNASLANGDQVRVQLTSNAACVTGSPANSNTVNMTVNPSVAASVSVAPSANPICAGTSVTFTATPTNGGAAPAYQWFLNGNPVGTNSATYTNASLANGDQVRVQLTSNAACVTGSPANSNTVNMTVNPSVAASVSIAPSANPICAGTSVTFTATPTNGGAAPTYQWFLNGNPVGTNSATYTNASLANGDQVRVQLASNAACVTGSPANSNTVNMTVNPAVAASVSIAPSANPICAGTSVTFTATPTNGGAAPTYQWFLNGNPVGTNSTTYTNASLTNGDQVRVQLTSDAACVTGSPANSNTVNMTVNAPAPVSVVISPSANNICAGTSVTFTATPSNGGSGPSFQWYLNGNPVGTNSATYTNTSLNNGDQVRVLVTSNGTCVSGNPATSNTVNMIVNPALPVSVSISPSSNPVCVGTAVTFTATPTNAGATPVYQWFLNGNPVGSNSPSYNLASPADNDQVKVVLTSSANCATGNPDTSNVVTMTVNSTQPVSVSIAPSANPVCVGTSVTFTATPVSGGTAPAYQWYLNGNPVGANSATYTSAALSNGDQVQVVLTSNNSCASGSPATSNTVVMTINPEPVVALGPDRQICVGDSTVLDAGNAGANYLWNTGATTQTISVFTAGTYSVQVDNGCTASDAIVVSNKPSPVVDLGPDRSLCEGGQTSLDAGVAGASYVWSTGETTRTITISNSGDYAVIVTSNGCVDSGQVHVDFDLTPPTDIDLGPDTLLCLGKGLLLSAGNEAGVSYQWQNGSTGNNFQVNKEGIYFVKVMNSCDTVGDTIAVTYEDCSCRVYLPNAFSPNGDGQNDMFRPLTDCPITQYRMSIFNRWNEKVYETIDPELGWDGMYNGEKQPVDTYIYYISFFDPNLLQTVIQKGVVSIIL